MIHYELFAHKTRSRKQTLFVQCFLLHVCIMPRQKLTDEASAAQKCLALVVQGSKQSLEFEDAMVQEGRFGCHFHPTDAPADRSR